MTASSLPVYAAERAARAHRAAQRASSAPVEHPLLRLQRRAGNAAVSRLVDSGLAGAVRREEAPEEEELQAKHDPAIRREEMPEDEELLAKHDPALQREQLPDEEEELQAAHDHTGRGAVGLEGGPLPDSAASQVESMRGNGAAVDDRIRSTMEASLNLDLGAVRVHQDASSDALARGMTARAFTTGSDIFLRGDASATDPHLMAHEITHVAQQAGETAPGVQGNRMTVGAADDPLEREADRVADAVVNGSGHVPEEA